MMCMIVMEMTMFNINISVNASVLMGFIVSMRVRMRMARTLKKPSLKETSLLNRILRDHVYNEQTNEEILLIDRRRIELEEKG